MIKKTLSLALECLHRALVEPIKAWLIILSAVSAHGDYSSPGGMQFPEFWMPASLSDCSLVRSPGGQSLPYSHEREATGPGGSSSVHWKAGRKLTADLFPVVPLGSH